MKKIIVAVAVSFGLGSLGTSQAQAVGFHFRGGGVHVDVGHVQHRNYYGGRHFYHNTSHYDYHPGRYVRHRSHYDYHRTGYYDYYRGNHYGHH